MDSLQLDHGQRASALLEPVETRSGPTVQWEDKQGWCLRRKSPNAPFLNGGGDDLQILAGLDEL